MSFLAPGFLIAAAAAALIVVGLHLLSTRDQRLDVLPTARFLPDLPVPATSRSVRFADLLLFVLRILLLLFVGAALAQPVLRIARQTVARIVVVDVSRAVGSDAELADSVAKYTRTAAIVIAFDSVPREMSAFGRDSARANASRGSLSGAFIAALRAAARIRDSADSLELVLISPLVAEESDAATLSIRALWPGRVTTVKIGSPKVVAQHDSIRIEWADSAPGTHWSTRIRIDTVSAIRAGDAVLIYPFVRRWQPTNDGDARVIARWADGEPAALEYRHSGGCTRSYGFALPAEGDAILRPQFQRLVASLHASCGEPRDFQPLAASVLDSIRSEGPLAPTALIARDQQRFTPLARWLLLAGLLLAIVEMFARRARIRTAVTETDASEFASEAA
jgi:hypothetical protein